MAENMLNIKSQAGTRTYRCKIMAIFAFEELTKKLKFFLSFTLLESLVDGIVIQSSITDSWLNQFSYLGSSNSGLWTSGNEQYVSKVKN
ncbi:hypothetical protein Nepgr_024309 [Nepenthes gracilis]|uniref:Uncharacterized protein n=1 Tax=Nepenthes gracilis TaxID=150966 RepID=A0AAD3T4G3_NEPGR|nr:hypothetical protein Nepgr_024309 [Nepenthes gracilis]